MSSPLANVNPLDPNDGSPDPMRLIQYGIRGVRLVIRSSGVDPAGRVRNYKNACQAAGLVVLGVVTEGESQGELYADDPCDITQLGNEPDRGGHPDSKSAADYVNWWNIYYDTWFGPGQAMEGKTVIGAGLASGLTSYWQNVQKAGGLKGACGFAIHPYAKTPFVAQKMVLDYRAITPTLPVYITEFHPNPNELAAFVTLMRQTSGVVSHAYFCWHNYSEGDSHFQLGEAGARILGAFG